MNFRTDIELDNMGFLIEYCSKHAQLYNEVANHLYERFGLCRAEISLFITYYIAEDRRKHENMIDSLYCKNKDCYEIKQEVIKIIKENIQDEKKD